MSILKKMSILSMGIVVGFTLISDSHAMYSQQQQNVVKPIKIENLKNPKALKDNQNGFTRSNRIIHTPQQQSVVKPIITENLKLPSILDDIPSLKNNKPSVTRSNSVIYTPIKKQHKIGTCFYCENPKNGSWESKQCPKRKEGYSCSPYKDKNGLMMVYTGAKQTITPSNSFDTKLEESDKFNKNRLQKYKMIPDIKAPWVKQSKLRNSQTANEKVSELIK